MSNSIMLKPGDRDYPQKILEFVRDHKDLYYIGRKELLEKPAIAIVGSRRCTRYGLSVTKEIASRAASRGIVVISGIAKGIDACAHRSVLEKSGHTIGVTAGGINYVYPKENKDIYDAIKQKGLLLSEHSGEHMPARYDFPTRNRIISALADAVVVVEATTRSGSLITAECAVEQGKPVYAVPGNITSVYSMGTNKLIREGARALALIDDIFENLKVEAEAQDRDVKLGEDERRIYDYLFKNGETSMQELAHSSMMDMGMVNSIVTILEMKGMVYCEMGKVILANFS